MDLNAYSDLVGAIYDCALEADLWPQTLRRLIDRFNFANADLALHRQPGGITLLSIKIGHSDADLQEIRRLEEHVPAVWGGMSQIATRPIDRPWIASRLHESDQLAQLRYVREFAMPRGLHDAVALILARDDTMIGSLGFGRQASHGPIEDETVAGLQLVLPHLQRAARISGLLDAAAHTARQFENVVEKLSTPVILVRADLSIVHVNSAAQQLLDTGNPLGTRDGVLTCAVPGGQRALVQIVARSADNETILAGSGVGLPMRTSFGQLHTLHVMPLGAGTLRPGLAQGAAAAIFVSTATVTNNLASDVLVPLFNFTPTEIRVFEHIAEGRTVLEIAELMSVAQSTVRTHVRRLFEKAGVNRQADLIRMATALSAPTVRRNL